MRNKTCVIICMLLFNIVFAQKEQFVDSIFYIKALSVVLNDYENENELLLLDTLFDLSLFLPPDKEFFEDTMEYYSTKDCWWNNMVTASVGPERCPQIVTYFSNVHKNDTLSAKYLLCFYQTYECDNYLRLDAEVFPLKRCPFIKSYEVFWFKTNSGYTESERYTFWFDIRDNSIYKCIKRTVFRD